MNSVTCERLFSKMKLVFGDHRLRLHSTKAGMIAFVAANKVFYPLKPGAKKRPAENKINAGGKVVIINRTPSSTPVTPCPSSSTPIPTHTPSVFCRTYTPDLPPQRQKSTSGLTLTKKKPASASTRALDLSTCSATEALPSTSAAAETVPPPPAATGNSTAKRGRGRPKGSTNKAKEKK